MNDFEDTAVFHWLTAYAGNFGFVMPYTRDEPWHWMLEGVAA
jgi:LAS superfamily LD-carboxypeptidase LdcB